MDFSILLVGSIPLIAVVFGLVEFMKAFGVAGRWLTLASMLTGITVGMSYQIALAGIPAGFAGWFEIVIFGLALGLVASGFYDFANSRFPKTDQYTNRFVRK